MIMKTIKVIPAQNESIEEIYKKLVDCKIIYDNVIDHSNNTYDVEIHMDFLDLPEEIKHKIYEDIGMQKIESLLSEEGNNRLRVKKVYYIELDNERSVFEIKDFAYSFYEGSNYWMDDIYYTDQINKIVLELTQKLTNIGYRYELIP